MKSSKGVPPEVEALGVVLEALGDKRLDDKQRGWVIASAVSNLGLAASDLGAVGGGGAGAGAGVGTGVGAGAAAAIPGQPGTSPHARAWLRAKSPKSVLQQVACLAFYLTHFRNTPHFKAKEISAMNTDAGGARIGNPRQSVNDATLKSGFLASAGSGNKQIAAYGEDVVNALPDQAAVKAIPIPRKARRKKAAKAS